MVPKQRQFIDVTQGQIAAAQEMWHGLSDWQHTDEALRLARDRFDGNSDLDTVLLKAALLDKLYATNVTYHLDLIEAARKITAVLATEGSGRQKVVKLAESLVEDKCLTSFASKYIHFFCDSNMPIYDWYAAFALTRHWGYPQAQIDRWREDYLGYCQSIARLKRRSGVSARACEMDHYLWLAGNWVWHQKHGEKAGINNELETFFNDPVKGQLAATTFGGLWK